MFTGILDHQIVLGLLTVNANDRTSSLTAVGRCRYDVGVDVSRLPDDGPWDSGMGLESLEGTIQYHSTHHIAYGIHMQLDCQDEPQTVIGSVNEHFFRGQRRGFARRR